MKNITPQIVGEVGKTPPTDTNLMINGLNLCIDWLSCSFDFFQMEYKKAPMFSWQQKEYVKSLDKINKLYEILTFPNSDERTFIDESKFGYKSHIILGEHIKIFFTGPLNIQKINTNFLDMSGQACKEFISRGGDFVKLFKFLFENGSKFTRVDAAIDKYTNDYFNLDKIIEYTKKHSYISPMHSWSIMTSGDKTTETIAGKTVYIGSKSSNTLICIYDKKLEQYSKGIECFTEAYDRVEIRFKQDRAEWFVSNFLAHSNGDKDYSFILNALRTVLEFKEYDSTDSNKSRWQSSSWWINFLTNASKVDFGKKVKEELSIQKNKDWVDRSVSKVLSRLYFNDPEGFMKDIFGLIYKKHNELDNSDIEAINKQRIKDKKELITSDDVKTLSVLVENIYKNMNGVIEDDKN